MEQGVIEMPNLRPSSLPVESSRAALPALLAQCEEIISYVEAFDRRANPEASRQALLHLAEMQRTWAAVSRPASRDEISAAIAMLTAGFPNMTRADLRIFGRLLRQEIATLQPDAVRADMRLSQAAADSRIPLDCRRAQEP
jgi:hypothetical protein